MTLSVDTSTMKAELSEFIGRVAFGRERILVLRRGKPIAALVSVEDLRALERNDAAAHTAAQESLQHPIMRVYGALADDDEWDAILEEIYADRLASTGREIDLDL